MAISVFAWDDAGAPTLTGEAGSLVNVFKQCLVDGYGAKTPLGWESYFNAAYTKAAFRSLDAAATKLWLFMDDSGSGTGVGKDALVRGYESLSGLDGNGDPTNPSGPFPTTAQASAGLVFHKSSTADATAREWMIISDGLLLYLGIKSGTTPDYQQWAWHCFGDIVSLIPGGDPYGCVLIAGTAQNPSSDYYAQTLDDLSTNYSSGSNHLLAGHYIARAWDQANQSAQLGKYAAWRATTWAPGALFTYPGLSDGGLYLEQMRLTEVAVLRGILPGVYATAQNHGLPHRTIVSGVEGLGGKDVMIIQSANGMSFVSGPAIDITGPWR